MALNIHLVLCGVGPTLIYEGYAKSMAQFINRGRKTWKAAPFCLYEPFGRVELSFLNTFVLG